MIITRQKLALLLGFFFVLGLSADPIVHSFEDEHHEIHQHSSVDCQVCENEIFKTYGLNISQGNVLVPINSFIAEDLLLDIFSANFDARAPPNS